MNSLVVQQYHWLVAALAAGVVAALVIGMRLARRDAVPELQGDDPPDAVARRQVLPHVMLLLVAFGVIAGLTLVLPAAMILRYIGGARVTLLLVVAIAIITAPLVYAWRARPF